MRPQCCFLFCSTVQYRLLTGHILCTSWWTYLISWRSNGMTSALTYILFSLLVLSSGTIVPQCCLRGELFKTLPSLYHRVHKCFEGPLMLKYLRITSVQGFERLWIWWKHLELIFFQIPPPPQKNISGAKVQISTIFYEISKHFAIDKATYLNTQVNFYFQLSQNEISTRFWITPIDTAILITAETAITIWQKTQTRQEWNNFWTVHLFLRFFI